MLGKWVGKPINESSAEQSARDGRNRAGQKFVFHLDRIVPRVAETRNKPEVVGNAERMFPDPPEQGFSQISRPDPNLSPPPLGHIGTGASSFALQDPIDL